MVRILLTFLCAAAVQGATILSYSGGDAGFASLATLQVLDFDLSKVYVNVAIEVTVGGDGTASASLSGPDGTGGARKIGATFNLPVVGRGGIGVPTTVLTGLTLLPGSHHFSLLALPGSGGSWHRVGNPLTRVYGSGVTVPGGNVSGLTDFDIRITGDELSIPPPITLTPEPGWMSGIGLVALLLWRTRR